MTGSRDADDLAEHLLDHYGRCAIAPCKCMQPGNPWFGRGCPNWRSNGAIVREGLMARARRVHEERKG